MSKLQSLTKRAISVTLPDGRSLQGQSFETTPLDIAKMISRSLAENALVARVKYVNRDQGVFEGLVDCDEEEASNEKNQTEQAAQLWDLNLPLEGDCHLELLDFNNEEGKQTFWHSSAHVVGSALELLLNGFLTHGPPLKEGGFFYDIFCGEKKVCPEDYQKIEKLCSQLAEKKL